MPEGPQFADWVSTMDTWGHLMLDTIKTVSEMVALGLGLDKDVFTQRMQYGPHLLAPTGTDLLKHGEVWRWMAVIVRGKITPTQLVQ